MEAELVTSACREDAAPPSPADGILSMGMSHGACGQANREPRWPQRGDRRVAAGAGAVGRWVAVPAPAGCQSLLLGPVAGRVTNVPAEHFSQ